MIEKVNFGDPLGPLTLSGLSANSACQESCKSNARKCITGRPQQQELANSDQQCQMYP